MTLEIWPRWGVWGAKGLLYNMHVPWAFHISSFLETVWGAGAKRWDWILSEPLFPHLQNWTKGYYETSKSQRVRSGQHAAHMHQQLQKCSLPPSLPSFLPSAWIRAWRSSGPVACSSYYIHLPKIQFICFDCYWSKGLSSKCLFMWTKWSTLLIRQLVVFYFSLLSAFGSFFCSKKNGHEETNTLYRIKTVAKGIIEITLYYFFGFPNASLAAFLPFIRFEDSRVLELCLNMYSTLLKVIMICLESGCFSLLTLVSLGIKVKDDVK